jgi:hypothetical protein
MRKPKMVCHIIIEGESAEELFAVGPIDLRDYFLSESLHVKPADVKSIQFNKVEKWDSIGVPIEGIKHKDNF